MKLERSESQVKFARELEDARNERRVIESEAERLSFKTRVAEEQSQKLALKVEKQKAEVNAMALERA